MNYNWIFNQILSDQPAESKNLWADNSAAHCSIGMAYIKYFSKFSPIAYYQGTSTGKNRQEEPHNYLICIYIAWTPAYLASSEEPKFWIMTSKQPWKRCYLDSIR
jgi:hypothetical protein